MNRKCKRVFRTMTPDRASIMPSVTDRFMNVNSDRNFLIRVQHTDHTRPSAASFCTPAQRELIRLLCCYPSLTLIYMTTEDSAHFQLKACRGHHRVRCIIWCRKRMQLLNFSTILYTETMYLTGWWGKVHTVHIHKMRFSY